MSTQANLQTAHAYLRAIETGDAQAIAASYAEGAHQTEWPNRLNAKGQHRSVPQMLSDFERGKAILSVQRYDVTGATASGDTVMLEYTWTGTLAVDLAGKKKGDVLTAHCAVAFEFRDGKIVAQRNYDCLDPF